MKKNKPTLIVITGPTAVGKTSAAAKVAHSYQTEIISADSRQIYRELNIGVAKPERDLLNRIKHHFIGEISIEENYTAARYEDEAIRRLSSIFTQTNVAVLTGGTGLYIKAILNGIDPIPASNDQIEKRWTAIWQSEGLKPLQEKLKSEDPAYANQVDMQNHRRLIRALTVIDSTGLPFSSFLKKKSKTREFRSVVINLTMERKLLYERINQRVDQMMKDGLLEEVVSLRKFWSNRSLQTVGYQEFFPYFQGEVSLDEAIDKVKQHSRNYAKRQITWIGNQLDALDVEVDEFENQFEKIISES